jgi:cytochrome P450
LANVASLSSDTETEDTIVHAIVHSDLPPSDKTFNRVFEEVATVTGAAFETIANTLRLILFHVYTNDEILQRLRKEINLLSANSNQSLPVEKLEKLPYFTATLMEGMRHSPTVASRAARFTDKDLFYRDWRIPAGTPVGMTTLLMHADEKLYLDPMRSNLDRWMDSTRGATAKYAPFSRGTRTCLGMQ